MSAINDALIDCVKAAGGSKVVGSLLWPDKTPEAAQRLLLDCLNEDRPQHLTPTQVVMVMRMARDRCCHVGMETLAAELHYAPPVPVEPEDERAKLQREFVTAVAALEQMAARLGVPTAAKPAPLRAAA